MGANSIVFFTLIILVQAIIPQIRYSSHINLSSTTNTGIICVKNESDIFYTFKRGSDATSADREIKVLGSNNGGISFNEVDITYPNNIKTEKPVISSTINSILVLYDYNTNTQNNLVCIARSTNNGSDFSLNSNSDINFWNVVGADWLNRSFVSDGISKYYIANSDNIFCSDDDGVSFQKIPSPPNTNSAQSLIKLTASTEYLVALYEKNDSLFVFKTLNSGLSWQLITSFIASPINYDLVISNGEITIMWTSIELGQYKIKIKRIIGSNIGNNTEILSSDSF